MIGLTVFQMSAPVSLENAELNWHLGRAEAVLYSPDTKVPRNAEVALRRAIPAVNSATKSIQVLILSDLRTLVSFYVPWSRRDKIGLLKKCGFMFFFVCYMCKSSSVCAGFS
jgi:hypothetical protein